MKRGDIPGELIKGHLEMLLLSILEHGAMHGYAIIEELRRRSGGTFQLPEGTIYPALHRLEGAGYLASTWSGAGGRKRRMYTLTGAGREALAAKRGEWETFAGAVSSVIHPAFEGGSA